MKGIEANDVRKSAKLWSGILAIAFAAWIVLASFWDDMSNWADERRARQGDSSALARVQLHYMNKSDKAKIEKWLIIGATANDPESIELLFSFASSGQLTLSGNAQRDWLREKIVMIAKQGNSRAATLLGEEFLKGSILPLDEEAGKLWLRRASAAGEHAAIYRLAKFFVERPTTLSDRIEAVRLLEVLYKTSPPESAYREFAKINLSKLSNATVPKE